MALPNAAALVRLNKLNPGCSIGKFFGSHSLPALFIIHMSAKSDPQFDDWGPWGAEGSSAWHF